MIFFPSTPVSDDVAPRMLCLPLYPSLTLDQVDGICGLLEGALPV